MNVFFIEFLIVFDDCVWRVMLIVFYDCFFVEFWLSLMIVFESYVDCLYWLLLMIVFFIEFWLSLMIVFENYVDCPTSYIFWLLNMYFWWCNIVSFNAFWYHLILTYSPTQALPHIFQQAVIFYFMPWNDTWMVWHSLLF